VKSNAILADALSAGIQNAHAEHSKIPLLE